jgi:uncharacterized protein YndB with AHSA1/START domain
MDLLNEILDTDPEREITTVRVFNFPRAMLFKAWTDPQHLKNWWGPNGFKNTFHEHDLKPGGKWSFTMHAPDGNNYAQECRFIKIKERELIAWTNISTSSFQVLTTFEELNHNKTGVIFKMLFSTIEDCKEKKKFVVSLNEENFDRLEAELITMNSR